MPHARGGVTVIGRALAAVEHAPRRWVQQLWGAPYIHARQDWAVVWPVLARLPASGVRLLDAGCGDGRWALEIAARRPGWTVVGLDQDAERLRSAESKRQRLELGNATFLRADFAEFDGNGAFDVVLSVCSAQYLFKESAALLSRFLAAAAAPGGLLILYGPRATAEAPWTRGLPRPSWHDVFTAADLDALCRNGHFEKVSLTGQLGRAGTLVKQVDLLATGRWRRAAMVAGLYGVECALSVIDRGASTGPDRPTLMWLLVARKAAS